MLVTAVRARTFRSTIRVWEAVCVTAVCPGPMDTEFLPLAGVTGRSSTFEFLPYCDQVRVAGGGTCVGLVLWVFAGGHRFSIA